MMCNGNHLGGILQTIILDHKPSYSPHTYDTFVSASVLYFPAPSRFGQVRLNNMRHTQTSDF